MKKRSRREAMRVNRLLHHQYREKAFKVMFHRCLYYVFSRPAITDAEYDRLEEQLAAFERRKKMKHPNSPTRTVGSDWWENYPVMVRVAVRQHLREEGLLKE